MKILDIDAQKGITHKFCVPITMFWKEEIVYEFWCLDQASSGILRSQELYTDRYGNGAIL